jgi:8-oxoguanine deaminase
MVNRHNERLCATKGYALNEKRALWIKDPLAILADNAGGGVVVRQGRIAELVPSGRTPVIPSPVVFEAGSYVVVPGLINTHHHFFQTLTRATALDRELCSWLKALYPVWAALTLDALDLAATLAMAELLLSGCTITTDHHYLLHAGIVGGHRYRNRGREAVGHTRPVHTRLDESLSPRRRAAA